MDLTPWKLPHGTYTMNVTSLNLHNGSYLMEHTPWKLLSGITAWKLPNGRYTMEVT